MGVSRHERDSGKEKVEQQRSSLEKRSKSLFKRVGSLDYVCKLRERRDLSYNLIRLFS